jgi:hypothetical protein
VLEMGLDVPDDECEPLDDLLAGPSGGEKA